METTLRLYGQRPCPATLLRGELLALLDSLGGLRGAVRPDQQPAALAREELDAELEAVLG